MLRPGVAGIAVDLGLPVGGFVDVIHLPFDPGLWPALGTVTGFVIWWIDERPQITDGAASEPLSANYRSNWVQLLWSEVVRQAPSAYCPCLVPG
ncbi:MAG: hypothetical protein JWM19_7279 [Actinomycetia bacterium]|nr:hypothetical protein [Actinomycetes bacterium]